MERCLSQMTLEGAVFTLRECSVTNRLCWECRRKMTSDRCNIGMKRRVCFYIETDF
jgi:hypothetical protein